MIKMYEREVASMSSRFMWRKMDVVNVEVDAGRWRMSELGELD